MASQGNDEVAWYLKSSCPVYFPNHDALTKSRNDFDAFIQKEIAQRHDSNITAQHESTVAMTDNSDTFTEITPSTTAVIQEGLKAMDVDEAAADKPESDKVQGTAEHPFMEGLLQHDNEEDHEMPDKENRMLTDNGDLAYQSTTNALVDLMAELEDVVTGPRLNDLLDSAWAADPLMTLKLMFNARSIHLGKSSRKTFYMCAGWLAQNHPLTLVANLKWLSRPVIEKKQKKTEDDEVVLVEEEKETDDLTKFDVKHGVSHGYWKDLLNILAIAANGKLNVLSDPADVLNSENPGIFKGKSNGARRTAKKQATGRRGASHKRVSKRGVKRSVTSDMYPRVQTVSADEVEFEKKPERRHWKEIRRETRRQRHESAIKAFDEDSAYRALHLTVARLFAEQLEADLKALRGDDVKSKRTISLCAKWAPSHDHFHDKQTFVVSSIAEILCPRESLDDILTSDNDRETYLRHAREKYRVDTSALRKHLEVVERNITAQTFGDIKYNRVPSVAMSKYSKVFCEKDFDNFEKYLDKVAEGKSSISGATLFPSSLVKLQGEVNNLLLSQEQLQALKPSEIVKRKMNDMQARVMDGQWNTLVQRMKDSGTLENCIAVADVSGSMSSPTFKDGTCPMDSSIGLSLLVASVTAQPFGGAFITFHDRPQVCKVDLAAPFCKQVETLRRAPWGGSTDFVAVFLDLILPMAIKNQLKPEDMVKRIFVFSDMQFNSAMGRHEGRRIEWKSSFDVIQDAYAKAGYEVPELVFWNLAGGRSGMASKPITTADQGTCLVSGYSQGMLKVFLENGGFEEEEDEDDDTVVIDEKGEEVKKEKKKIDALGTVKKAIGHQAYEMLEVLD